MLCGLILCALCVKRLPNTETAEDTELIHAEVRKDFKLYHYPGTATFSHFKTFSTFVPRFSKTSKPKH